MNPKIGVRIKKPALTPALSPGEREKQFPRPGKIQAPDLRWFRGSMREILIRGNLSPILLRRLRKTRRGRNAPSVLPNDASMTYAFRREDGVKMRFVKAKLRFAPGRDFC